jgi:hypothetical protein
VKRKKWISTDKRPIVTVTGSRKRTVVFGSLSFDGKKQLFKQYDKFDSDTFVDYLKQIQKRFGNYIIFVDRATPHCSKIKLQKDFSLKIKILSDWNIFQLVLQNLMQ